METDPRFTNTMFVVEADSFAHQELWVKHSRESHESGFGPARPIGRPREWRQDSRGFMAQVGGFGGMPVNAVCSWATIDGQLVMFYYGCSMVTHSEMIEKWIEARCNPRWDGGRRLARCDAMNFHHCLDAIDEKNAG